MPTRLHTPTLPQGPYFRLSLLGHKVLDLVGSTVSPKGVLARLPLIRYTLLVTVLLAGYQYATFQTADLGHAVEAFVTPQPAFATASVFASTAPNAGAERAAADVVLIDHYRKPVAQLSLKLDLDRSVLMAMALLRSQNFTPAATPDLPGLAGTLAASARERGAVTPGEWLSAAADTFEDPAAAEATMAYYLRRYGL